jgi:hypothetical protein
VCSPPLGARTTPNTQGFHVGVVFALLADEDCRTLIVADTGSWLSDFLSPLGFRVVAGPDERGVVVHERRLDESSTQRPDDVLSN